MNVVPAFLRKEPHVEGTPRQVPQTRPEENRQFAMDFMNKHDRLLEENAWLRTENGQLRVEVKAAQEHARMVESELGYVRDELDRIKQHDYTMVAGVDHLVLIANKLLENSRASPYAPPGTGQTDGPERPMDATDEAGLKILTAALMPENRDA